MAFDKETRNLLARTVSACRRRLTEDVEGRLTGVFGLHPDETAAAGRLRDLLAHYVSGQGSVDSGRKERLSAAFERTQSSTRILSFNPADQMQVTACLFVFAQASFYKHVTMVLLWQLLFWQPPTPFYTHPAPRGPVLSY